MVEAAAGERGLSAHRGNLDDATAALRAQVGQGCPGNLHRADEVGVDLVDDLFVGHFFGGAQQAVAGIVDDDVDPAEFGECLVHYHPDGWRVRHVEVADPQKVAMGGLQVVDRARLADRARDAVAAGEKLLGQLAAESRS